MYSVIINSKTYVSDTDKKLLPFLREDLHLLSAKDGCSEGACGTCTVIIDGKATKACLFSLSKLEGKKIITLEGLSERELQVYSTSFASCGAVQCGYCIPGMIMSAKALIDQNPNPTSLDVKKAIRGNICRCTGYVKIEEAILLAAKTFREEGKVQEDLNPVLSGSMQRVDAIVKARGEAVYTDDIFIEGMLHAKVLRSAYPRARVLSIDTSEVEKDERLTRVFSAKDVPFNKHGHIVSDWPVFIEIGQLTHYVGDAICMVVSPDINALDELVSKIKVEYEVLPGVYSPREALKDEVIVHEGKTNLLTKEVIVRGDSSTALKNSAHTVSYTFTTPHTEHAFMEVEAAIGLFDEETGGVKVYTSGQSIYDEQHEISRMLALDISKVRCISTFVGGGFGGKEDMSVQHHAALAAYLLKQPVKLKLTRQESLIVHPKRHPMEMEMVVGCDEEGFLTGMECNIYADTGAYASLGGPVLQRACTHAAGPYNYQNITVIGYGLYTNNVPSGAYRGFGVTQSCFALECSLNELAKKVGLDEWEIRYKNAIVPGNVLPNGQIANPDTAYKECLEAIKPHYYSNKIVGLAGSMKNSGVGVGLDDIGRCILSIENGKVHIRTSAACMGQGLATVTTQIVCNIVNLDPSLVIAETPDTSRTPDSGTSTASRQTAFTGEATRLASLKLKAALEEKDLQSLEGEEFYAEFLFETDPITSTKENPVSHLAYSYSCQLVILNDDGSVKEVIAASDIGTVINRINAEGQIEGGVAMGLGYALKENFISEEGYVKSTYGKLGLLRSTEMPEKITSIFVKSKNVGETAFGAKGVGELCTVPTAPAVQNAYYHFDNIFRVSLPLEKTYYRK